MEIQRREISQAIGELAYVVATADKGQSAEERAALYQIAEHELDHESWAARSSFELRDEVVKPSIEEAYNGAIHELRKYKDPFTAYLKEKALLVLQKVMADINNGLASNEAFVLNRFRKDLSVI